MSKRKERGEGKRPSTGRFKSICILGDSEGGTDGEYLEAASELGKVLAARKINIVYGGGIQGLRGSAAISASLRGSQIMGVFLREEKKFTIGTELKVSSLPERMGCMFHYAEAFIALPGGLKTLDGLFSITYWARLNYHKKPLGLLNINGFYDSLLSFLDHAVTQGFIPQATHRSIMSAPTADELIDQLQIYASNSDPLVKQIDRQSPESSEKQELDLTLRL